MAKGNLLMFTPNTNVLGVERCNDEIWYAAVETLYGDEETRFLLPVTEGDPIEITTGPSGLKDEHGFPVLLKPPPEHRERIKEWGDAWPGYETVWSHGKLCKPRN